MEALNSNVISMPPLFQTESEKARTTTVNLYTMITEQSEISKWICWYLKHSEVVLFVWQPTQVLMLFLFCYVTRELGQNANIQKAADDWLFPQCRNGTVFKGPNLGTDEQ